MDNFEAVRTYVTMSNDFLNVEETKAYGQTVFTFRAEGEKQQWLRVTFTVTYTHVLVNVTNEQNRIVFQKSGNVVKTVLNGLDGFLLCGDVDEPQRYQLISMADAKNVQVQCDGNQVITIEHNGTRFELRAAHCIVTIQQM